MAVELTWTPGADDAFVNLKRYTPVNSCTWHPGSLATFHAGGRWTRQVHDLRPAAGARRTASPSCLILIPSWCCRCGLPALPPSSGSHREGVSCLSRCCGLRPSKMKYRTTLLDMPNVVMKRSKSSLTLTTFDWRWPTRLHSWAWLVLLTTTRPDWPTSS